MKTRCQATALVVTLSLLMLLTAIAVAFFSQVTTEAKSAKSYADSVSTQQLADSAVSMVMAQIQEAASVENGAWGSQPGMIRVYGSGGEASDQIHAYYKLYSSNNMVLNTLQAKSYNDDRFTTEVPFGENGWDKQAALFTDLNQPISRAAEDGSGKIIKKYPILNPEIATDNQEAQDGEAGKTGDTQSWKSRYVEGFYIDRVEGNPPDAERAPMPVRWLYMLKDGTLTAPDTSKDNGFTAVWEGSGANVPTKANPIVGRVAFWTDDDSCKVNINTAAGFSDAHVPAHYNSQTFPGTFWDTPRFNVWFDRGYVLEKDYYKPDFPLDKDGGGLATGQPTQFEYQRYPGHPATTSLGLVFGRLLNSEQLYKLTPRYSPSSKNPLKGSFGGTQRAHGGTDDGTKMTADDGYMDRRFERLYANVEELVFSSEMDGAGKRTLNDKILEVGDKTVTPELVDQLRFFMTAHSRSPDLNVFGRPRVSIWPVWLEDSANKRSTFDSIIRFCSTIASSTPDRSKIYSFERKDPYTRDDILMDRNMRLMGYLRDLTSRPVPGYSSTDSMTFEKKYGKNRDQILTEIFDYIRSTNLKDANRPIPAGSVDVRYSPTGYVVPTVAKIGNSPNETKGFGRFPTVSEASLVFYHTWQQHQRWWEYLPLESKPEPDYATNPLVANWMRAFVIFEGFNPAMGYAPHSSPSTADFIGGRTATYEVTFQGEWAINKSDGYKKLGFPATKVMKRAVHASGGMWGGRNYGGLEGVMHMMDLGNYRWRTDTANLPKINEPFYPFHSEGEGHYGNATYTAGDPMPEPGIPIPYTGDGRVRPDFKNNKACNGTFDFLGGTVQLEISWNVFSTDKKVTVQAMDIHFPPSSAWRVPTPQLWVQSGTQDSTDPATGIRVQAGGFGSYWDTAGRPDGRICNARNVNWRIRWAREHSNDVTTGDPHDFRGRFRQILQPGDTVRSMEATAVPGSSNANSKGGDFRLTALYSKDFGNGGATPGFVPANGYHYTGSDPSQQIVHAQSLRLTDGQYYYPGEQGMGKLVAGAAAGDHYGNDRYSSVYPDVHADTNGVSMHDNLPGDYDTGFGGVRDGAYINKADEGNVVYKKWEELNKWYVVRYPYFDSGEYEAPGDTYFSPNRQIPSAIMFGSLPSRPLTGYGWETLCFNPYPAGGKKHYGIANGNVRDHLLADLFTMPVVEPYAISEPLSTAGRVNLNYQIEPFRYIRRSTALRAALHPLRLAALKPLEIKFYKNGPASHKRPAPPNPPQKRDYRFPVDRDLTIKSFDGFFKLSETNAEQGFFKTASEVCDRYLYPKIPTQRLNYRGNDRDIEALWEAYNLQGDNVREKPYADLLPRVTAKSNTYTVHMRVQALRQPVGKTDSDYLKWKQTENAIAGEYRGETTIERYLDAEDPIFKGDAEKTVDPDQESLEPYYRFRVIHNKRFLP